jgi:hypothetical protein
MLRRLCFALLTSLLLACFAAPLARADSIPIGQMVLETAGGCHPMGCYKTRASVGIWGGLTDSKIQFPGNLMIPQDHPGGSGYASQIQKIVRYDVFPVGFSLQFPLLQVEPSDSGI